MQIPLFGSFIADPACAQSLSTILANSSYPLHAARYQICQAVTSHSHRVRQNPLHSFDQPSFVSATSNALSWRVTHFLDLSYFLPAGHRRSIGIKGPSERTPRPIHIPHLDQKQDLGTQDQGCNGLLAPVPSHFWPLHPTLRPSSLKSRLGYTLLSSASLCQVLVQ